MSAPPRTPLGLPLHLLIVLVCLVSATQCGAPNSARYRSTALRSRSSCWVARCASALEARKGASASSPFRPAFKSLSQPGSFFLVRNRWQHHSHVAAVDAAKPLRQCPAVPGSEPSLKARPQPGAAQPCSRDWRSREASALLMAKPAARRACRSFLPRCRIGQCETAKLPQARSAPAIRRRNAVRFPARPQQQAPAKAITRQVDCERAQAGQRQFAGSWMRDINNQNNQRRQGTLQRVCSSRAGMPS